MTSEEMERAISFLLDSQAKHDAQIGELRDRVAELAEQVGEINRVIRLQSESQSQFNEMITNAVISLIDSQRQTDARINQLAGVVERLVEKERGE